MSAEFTPASVDASNVNPADWASTVNAAIAEDPAAVIDVLGISQPAVGLDFTALKLAKRDMVLPNLKVYPAALALGLGPMHPSVVKFENSWNGYRYWMAYTPYGSGGAGNEDPSIAVSQDGENWFDHPLVTNPLVVRPAPPDSYNGIPFNVNDYNSDTNLFFYDGLLYMSWRHRLTSGGDAYLWYMTSSNGYTWSARHMMMDNTARVATGGRDCIAQSVFPMEGGGFEMWGINQTQAGAYVAPTATATVSGGAITAITPVTAGSGYTSIPFITVSGGGGIKGRVIPTMSNGVNGGSVTGYTIENAGSGYATAPTLTFGSALGLYELHRYTAPAIGGPWTHQSKAALNGFPAGLTPWHFTMHKVGAKWVLLTNAIAYAASSDGPAYFAESTDGVNFTVAANPVAINSYKVAATSSGTYKSEFMVEQINGRTMCRLWLSSSSLFNNALADFRRPSSQEILNGVMPRANALLGDYLFGDDFNRADAAVIGTASCGLALALQSGAFTISGKSVKGTTTANNYATRDMGYADVRVKMRIKTAETTTQATQILFRGDGTTTNTWYFGWQHGTNVFRLGKYVAGTSTPVYDLYPDQWNIPAMSNGDWIEVEAIGDKITLIINGVRMVTIKDTDLKTLTYGGIKLVNANVYVDAFTVERIR